MKLIKKNSSDETYKAYRPISLLSVPGKIFESIITKRLSHFVLSRNLLSANQFGFIPQRSSIDAISVIVNKMQKTFDDKKFGILISLDISKAFDSACFDIILSKLRGLNIPPNLYRMFVSFLDNRHVILPIQDFVVSKPFRRGCPQGGKSSPLLWNILINDVFDLSLPPNCHLQAYADDLVLYCDHEDLNTCVQNTSFC